MQTEFLDNRKTWKTVVELITAKDVWVDFCHGKGRHSYIGYMSPDQ